MTWFRDYDGVGVDDDDQYMYSKLTKPHLSIHKLLDPEKETQWEDYFYSLLLLFVPFRQEADLLGQMRQPKRHSSGTCSRAVVSPLP